MNYKRIADEILAGKCVTIDDGDDLRNVYRELKVRNDQLPDGRKIHAHTWDNQSWDVWVCYKGCKHDRWTA